MTTGILVVEDEAIVAHDIATTLRDLGYIVTAITGSGEEAIELAGRPGTDLVLMDIMLKGKLDGVEAAEQIKTHYNLPVVYLTAHNDSATLERAKITTPYGYILKPYEERELHTNLEIALYRHQIEKRLKAQSEELETARRLAALGGLASGIAHDLNNLLTIIMGHFWFLQRAEDLPPDVQRSRVEAEVAVKRARGLARQLLIFSSGEEPFSMPLALNQLVQEVVQPLLKDTGKDRIEFTPAEPLWEIEADYEQISQATQYIIQHILNTSPPESRLSIYTGNVVVPGQIEPGLQLPAGNYVLLDIAGEGAEIEPEYLPRIFDPYFSERLGGSGLGLAIAYSVITRHRGYITVRSNRKARTDFQIYLPVSRIASTQDKTLQPQPQRKGVRQNPKRVLVMDDEAGIRKLLKNALSEIDYEVTTAQDGMEAITLYQEAQEEAQPFAAVLLDLTIANGMGGIETLKKLQELDSTVRAIVSSGYSEDAALSNFREFGFKGRVKKPYQMKELLQVLQEVTGE